MVTLECLSHLSGPRFLDGRVLDGTTGLAPYTFAPYTGTFWAVTTLAPGIVKFRCMTHVQGSRFLDGRTNDGGVGLAAMLPIPLSGERWAATEHDGVVTLECLGVPPNPQFRFLDGRTLEGATGLAPTTDFPFSGTHWRVQMHGKIVVFHCLAKGTRRFLDGRLHDSSVGLAPMALGRFTGTRWLLQETGGAVTLKCLGELPYTNRFLDGDLREGQRVVRLAPHTEPPFSGTRWLLTEQSNNHSDVQPGTIVTLRSLADVPGSEPGFLDGIVQSGEVGLANTTADPFTGTRWRMLPAGLYWEPCPRVHEHQATIGQRVHVIRTHRVGQITGTSDPEGFPLINHDTASYGVPGVDLGANSEHGDKLFIFFGDVVRGSRSDGPEVDADLVALTQDASVTESGPLRGVHLHLVTYGQYFDPFWVDGQHQLGVTKTFEVPSGAFSDGDQCHVFFHTANNLNPRISAPPDGCYLASKSDPAVAGPFHERFLFSPRELPNGGLGADYFSGVAPVLVKNAHHPWLPLEAARSTDGVVLFGIGYNPRLEYSAIHLAWMPLKSGGPVLSDVRYFVESQQRWADSPDSPNGAVPLFGKQTNLQSISAAYIEEADKWIIVHMTANDTDCINGPIVARVGTPPLNWSAQFNLFDPCREQAFARYMHWPDLDPIQMADPLRDPTTAEQDRIEKGPGNAYGAFLLNRYTRWNKARKELDLYYLLSLWSPYQVQVMHSTLRFVGLPHVPITDR